MSFKKILEKYEIRSVKTKEEKEGEELPPQARSFALKQTARAAGSAAAHEIFKGMAPQQRRNVIDKHYRKFLKDNNIKGYAPELFQVFVGEIQRGEDIDEPDLLN